ncbi:MAG: hypothetical protein JL50_18755 [Peptococcaceae bacterium BICA1-7]|nr:MAG: hypothetical protein JL50_18755 [Peptococcaceae bacterium BICA1-7]HBV99022.1 MFS transporter [Desulfotomaculum sp.]
MKHSLYGLSARDYTLAAVLFLAEFSRGAYFLTYLPLYSSEFPGLTVAAAGIAASAHFLTENILKIHAGWYYDRRGRVVLQGGLALGLLSLAVAGSFPGPFPVIAASALMGAGFSPLWVSIIAEVAPVDRKNRPLLVSLVFTAWLSGAGAGLAGINFFISRGYGTAFAVIFCSLLAALTASLFCPPPPCSRESSYARESVLAALRQVTSGRILTLFLLPGMFLQTLSASILLPVLPVFATNNLGLSHKHYGVLLLAGGAATVAALFPMGRLVSSLKPQMVLSCAFFTASAALSGLLLAGNRHNAIIWVLVMGLSYAAVLPSWNTLLSRAVPPDQQATGWGLFSTVEGLGITIGPALGGILAVSSGPGTALIAAAGILMVMTLFYAVFPLDSLL